MYEIWRNSVKWYDKIRNEETLLWKMCIETLDILTNCSIPCSFIKDNNEDNNIQLNKFCDTSITSYAAAAYLRVETNDKQVRVSWIMAKNKVAPLKPLFITRFELQAVLRGARLIKYVEAEVKIKIELRLSLYRKYHILM
jgi:hypothetical protein